MDGHITRRGMNVWDKTNEITDSAEQTEPLRLSMTLAEWWLHTRVVKVALWRLSSLQRL